MRRRLACAAALLACACVPPDWGANALLHPPRTRVWQHPRDLGFAEDDLRVPVDEGVTLSGWLVRTRAPRRGLVVYLHGVGDNSASGVGLVAPLGKLGFDVAAYDARAHGDSTGDTCTYGARERRDVGRVLDAIAARGVPVDRVILLGVSMGAAVAIQAAPDEPRVRAVAALAPFSDLEHAARDMKPWVLSESSFRAAEVLAEERAHFRVADVAPAAFAARMTVPLLLVHGDADEKLPLAHSRRILARATGRDVTLTVIGGGHHEDLLAHRESWTAIEALLARVAPTG